MRKTVVQSRALAVLFVLTLTPTTLSRAAPGDIVGRIDTRPTCSSTVLGLGFDGALLYYTLLFDPQPGTVHRVEAKTGIDRGSFRIMRGGVPYGLLVAGIDYDPNRRWVWVGGTDEVYGVSIDTGEILFEIWTGDTFSVLGLAHEPTRDIIWESDNSDNEINGWCPERRPDVPPTGQAYWHCGFIGTIPEIGGLAFDGVDLWEYTAGWLPPPVPNGGGFLYPSSLVGQIDYPRVLDPPGVNYNDIAFDCQTFPVPVVWTPDNLSCDLLAFEVKSNAPCSVPGSNRLLRMSFAEVAAAPKATKLPLMTATAERIFGVTRPLSYRDDNAQFPILIDTSRSFTCYRLLGPAPADQDQGNVLKLTKDAKEYAVVASE